MFELMKEKEDAVKKSLSLFLVIALTCLMGAACGGKKPASPQAGSATAEDLLSLFPKDTRGLLVVDVQKIMRTEAVAKAIKDNEKNEKYVKFVQDTGIDPQKDIFFFAGAMTGDLSQKNPDGAALVNLKYDKTRLLESMKKERGEFTTADYNGLTVYQFAGGESEKPVSGIFLDESNILAGSDAAVKKMADVYQKKAENVWKNAEMVSLLKGMNTSAMVWGGVALPPQTVEQATSQNPMLGAFSTIQSLLLSVDYKDETMLMEIKAMSPDAEKNKNMAETLTGFKALGSGAAAKEPLVGQLLNNIEIVSAADSVKLVVRIPSELMQSLSDKAKAKKTEPVPETDTEKN
jgi:hypothetical protein